MFKSKKRLVAILMLSSLVCASSLTGFSQDDRTHPMPPRFNNASALGSYAVVGTFGANLAQELGIQTLDGRGGFTGSSILNAPGPNGQRILLNLKFTGTYSVLDDGTGVDTFTVTLPDGRTATLKENFVITKSEIIDGELIATEIVSALQTPSAVVPGGVFLTHTYTRQTPPARSTRCGHCDNDADRR